MDISSLDRRQALTEWRDRQLFAVLSMINGAAIAARATLDEQLRDAALTQSIWDPTAFVRIRIDALMREGIYRQLDNLLGQAASELGLLDPQFVALATTIAESGTALEMPATPEPITPPVAVQPAADRKADPVPLTTPTSRFSRIGSLVGSGAREWRTKAIDGMTDFAASMSRTIQDRSGLDERMRRLATQHIAVAWMGDTGEPRPLKTQLIAIINEVTQKARGMSQ
ncbi:hypothetical protein [Sphingobium sp. SA916]|uniref:hypothetical protein n=1 Tax=Sphingobium sp. SA916 TaxID=1851207 RepID=UPI001559C5EB|nr:hypothetical protein [Sphingobium sp. SA916]